MFLYFKYSKDCPVFLPVVPVKFSKGNEKKKKTLQAPARQDLSCMTIIILAHRLHNTIIYKFFCYFLLFSLFFFFGLRCAGELRILGFEKKAKKKKRKNGSCCSFFFFSTSWNYDSIEVCPATITEKKTKGKINKRESLSSLLPSIKPS